MELIAHRVAQGESIASDKKQAKILAEAYADRSKRDLALQNKSRTSVNTMGTPLSPTASIQPPPSIMTNVDGRSVIMDEQSAPRPSDVTGTTAVGTTAVGAPPIATIHSDVS